MKKVLIISIIVLTLVSCTLFRGRGVDFEIKNDTQFTITEVKIMTTDKSTTPVFSTIDSGQSVSGFLKMEKDRNDGSYILEFNTKSGERRRIMTGYYSNGVPSEHKIIFKIERDTIYYETMKYY